MNTVNLAIFGVAVIAAIVWFLVGTYPIFRYSFKKTKWERFLNTDELSRKWIIDHLLRAKNELLILSGNLNPKVYNQEFVDVLCEKLEENSQFVVKVLSGPEVFVLRSSGNPLYNLSLDNPFPEKLHIQFLPKRPVHHFRAVDGTHLFVEDPHDSHSQYRMVSTLENSFFKGWMYKREFERRWTELGRADAVSLTSINGGAS